MPAKGWRSFAVNQDFIKAKKRISTLDSKMKGQISESYVLAKLAEAGFDVWKPYMNNHKADLGVIIDNRLIRIQVKTATFDETSDRFRGSTTTKDKNGNHISYDGNLIDFFIFVCLEASAFYVIPAKICIKRRSLNFYPHRNKSKARYKFDTTEYKDAFRLIV
jgi:hypothetical protein